MPDPKDDKKAPLTGEALIKAAAKFTGVKEEDIFDAVDKGDGRFGVVTRDGRKFNQTPKEREQALLDAEVADKARRAARDARVARRAAGK